MSKSLFVIRKGKRYLSGLCISRFHWNSDLEWATSIKFAMRFGELDGFLICQYLNYKEPGTFVLELDDQEDTAE